MVLRLLCLCHALANRLKDFSLAELRDEQPESELLGVVSLYVRARSSSALHVAFYLQFPKGPADSHSRGLIGFDKVVFAGKTQSIHIRTFVDRLLQTFEDIPVLWQLSTSSAKKL